MAEDQVDYPCSGDWLHWYAHRGLTPHRAWMDATPAPPEPGAEADILVEEIAQARHTLERLHFEAGRAALRPLEPTYKLPPGRSYDIPKIL